MTTLLAGMKVICITPKSLVNFPVNLEKNKEYTIAKIANNETLMLEEFPGIHLYKTRFIVKEGEGAYNPVIYKIRVMQQRFEQRTSSK
jgi:hypothetical protein